MWPKGRHRFFPLRAERDVRHHRPRPVGQPQSQVLRGNREGWAWLGANTSRTRVLQLVHSETGLVWPLAIRNGFCLVELLLS